MSRNLATRLYSVVEPGDFIGTSGKRLQHYINIKEALLRGELARNIMEEFGRLIPAGTTRIVGDAGLGGQLLVSLLVCRYGISGALTLTAEQQKRLEETRSIVGYVPGPTDRVLVVDDVCTTGKSLREIREILRPTQASIVGYATVVKRGEPDLDAPFGYLCTEKEIMQAA